MDTNVLQKILIACHHQNAELKRSLFKQYANVCNEIHKTELQLKAVQLDQDLVSAEEWRREGIVVACQFVPLVRLQAIQQQ